jgi:hypothetical protein
MIVTIHQPDFLPWLGFFERWRQSDLLILLDDVQFLRRGWHHRDQVKTTNGVTWLTVPTRKKGKYDQRINEVAIDNTQNWRRKHLRLIKSSYMHAPYFKTIFSELSQLYSEKHENLMDLNWDMLEWSRKRLDIRTTVQHASVFHITASKTQRIVELCRAVGADTYLTGMGAKDYLEKSQFETHGIEVMWHSFDHPVYPQLHGHFQPNLSVLDYLMMEGGRD